MGHNFILSKCLFGAIYSLNWSIKFTNWQNKKYLYYLCQYKLIPAINKYNIILNWGWAMKH